MHKLRAELVELRACHLEQRRMGDLERRVAELEACTPPRTPERLSDLENRVHDLEQA